MYGSTDDFREVYKLPELWDLLLGAKERYLTARATIYEVRNGALASRTAKRFHDHATEHGMIYYLYSDDDVPLDEEEDEVPDFSWIWNIDDWETVSELWHARPDRWRVETRERDVPETTYEVVDGGQRWVYDPPDEILYDPDNYASRRRWPILASLLDPSYELPDFLFDSALVRITGRQALFAGRNAFEIEARTISLDYPPRGLSWVEGPDDFSLWVDAEVGVILRYAERLDGEAFYVAQITKIAFEDEFPEGTFALDLPGVEFRRSEN